MNRDFTEYMGTGDYPNSQTGISGKDFDLNQYVLIISEKSTFIYFREDNDFPF